MELSQGSDICEREGCQFMSGSHECMHCGKPYDCSSQGHIMAVHNNRCIHCKKTRAQIIHSGGFIHDHLL